MGFSIHNSEYSKVNNSLNISQNQEPNANVQLPDVILNEIPIEQPENIQIPLENPNNSQQIIENNPENNIQESQGLDEEPEQKTNYSSFIMIVLTNSILLQGFLILMIAYFLWDMSYIVIILFLCTLDIGAIKITIDSLRNSKFF